MSTGKICFAKNNGCRRAILWLCLYAAIGEYGLRRWRLSAAIQVLADTVIMLLRTRHRSAKILYVDQMAWRHIIAQYIISRNVIIGAFSVS